MDRTFKKICKDKSGYTLAELLVVVAIIGVLVSVSVPVFTSQISKARRAANQANLRAARAAAVAEYLSENEEGDGAVIYAYNIESGTVKIEDTVPSGISDVKLEEISGDEVYEEIYIKITDGTAEAAAESGSETVIMYAK